MLSPCSLNGTTLEVTFTSPLLKLMMPMMFVTRSRWHLIPSLSISVDNAALKVAEHVAQKLNADGDPTLPLRNPAHCIDLLSKDLAKSK